MSERWREVGVTHWHLVVEDTSLNSRERYEEGWLARRARRSQEWVADPHEAMAWLAEQRSAAISRSEYPARAARRAGLTPADWQPRHELSLWLLQLGELAGSAVAISGTRSVEIFAVPMTDATCSQHASAWWS